MSLEGKVAIVTGAARGLGRAYALRLARLGVDVAVLDVDLQGAAKWGEKLSAATVVDEIRAFGRRSIGIETDLTVRRAADDAIQHTLLELGRIDILINNAGGALTPVERSKPSIIPDEDIEVTLAVNLRTTINCCQAVIPIMRAQHSGVIVNTSSQLGHSVSTGGAYALYGASKAAVAQYTRSLAAEVGPDGIRANCIAPGVMLTARVAAQAHARGIGVSSEAQHIPLRRLGQPDDCAGVVEFLVSDLSRYVTGQCISVCGGVVLTPT